MVPRTGVETLAFMRVPGQSEESTGNQKEEAHRSGPLSGARWDATPRGLTAVFSMPSLWLWLLRIAAHRQVQQGERL